MRTDLNAHRFDLVEMALVAVFAAVFAAVVVSSLRPNHNTYGDELTQQVYASLRTSFGPAKYSEHEEEWIIRDFFGGLSDGVFVDIGANHYKQGSNTYYLEAEAGWSGIAVDPQASFAPDYRKHRPRTRFYPFFVSNESNKSAKLFVGRNSLVASSDQLFTESFGAPATATDVPTITLTDLLDSAGIQKIDLLSIDVELAEPAVLAGFAVNRFQPRLVCIEGHPQVRQQDPRLLHAPPLPVSREVSSGGRGQLVLSAPVTAL